MPDPEQHVWLYSAARKLAGRTETELVAMPDLEAYVMRPGFVLGQEKSVMRVLPWSVKVDELSEVLLDVVVHGAKKRTWENADLRRRGAEVLTER